MTRKSLNDCQDKLQRQGENFGMWIAGLSMVIAIQCAVIIALLV